VEETLLGVRKVDAEGFDRAGVGNRGRSGVLVIGVETDDRARAGSEPRIADPGPGSPEPNAGTTQMSGAALTCRSTDVVVIATELLQTHRTTPDRRVDRWGGGFIGERHVREHPPDRPATPAPAGAPRCRGDTLPARAGPWERTVGLDAGSGDRHPDPVRRAHGERDAANRS
jgi:hypothetical protein